jgi:Dihydroorotase and related cyclic amidohydrolases
MSPGTVDAVISGGTLVGPGGTVEGSLSIDGKTIVAVGDGASLPDADERVDASGRLVIPGLVAPHVHAGDDPFTIETATHAAALGGVTTFVSFAWEGWDGPDSVYDSETSLIEGIDQQRANGEGAVVDYSSHGTLAAGAAETLDCLEAAVERGVTSFKMFTAYDAGVSNGYIDRAFRRIADLDAVGLVHTEDDVVCESLTGQLRAEDRGEPEAYPRSRPDYAEAMAADDIARLATEAGVQYYGVHASCRKAADRPAAYQDDGSRIRAETVRTTPSTTSRCTQSGGHWRGLRRRFGRETISRHCLNTSEMGS